MSANIIDLEALYPRLNRFDRLLGLDLGTKTIGVGHKSGHLYLIDVSPGSSIALAVRTGRTWYEWHCALGHLNKSQLWELHTKELVTGMDLDNSAFQDFDCDAVTRQKCLAQ